MNTNTGIRMRRFLGIVATLGLFCGGSLRAEKVILEDQFNYTGWDTGVASMQREHWEPLLTNKNAKPSLLSLDNGKASALVLFNRGVWRDFSTIASLTKDFTLSIRLQTDKPRRGQYVAITSAPNAQGLVGGYAFAWDSGTDGKGFFYLTKFNMADDTIGTLTSGDRLGTPIHSPAMHGSEAPTFTSDFVAVVMTWNSTGRLTLNVNDVEIISLNDSTFHTFSRIYIDGCQTGYFTDLKLTTKTASE